LLYQRTLSKKISVAGIGLHSGKRVELTLNPAPVNFGIQFQRTDIKNSTPIKACTANVSQTLNNTTIGNGANTVHTVEHLLAVLYGFGIDNVFCEINGPEVPIMDGSGASFVFVIKEAGITKLNSSKKFMLMLEPVRVDLGDKWVMVEPSSKLVIDSTIVFPHPQIQNQREIFEFSCENFLNDISRARTFGLLKDVDVLKRKGLIKGGSLNNCIVLDEYQVINEEGIRFKNEFVRHKILDTLGDMSLLGFELAGKITSFKSGHNLHNMLCKKILETPKSYEIVSANALEEETIKTLELPLAISFSS
jgi:UDP-3-O-[3-hydroxymyristoyl] N-acetylglucosamine deacetylase